MWGNGNLKECDKAWWEWWLKKPPEYTDESV